jgi:REP element-mobilizing transposase RayT
MVIEHQHLKRLRSVWAKQPVYFLTVCVANRRPLLAVSTAHDILLDEWKGLHERHGWAIGRYVVMPDHVHFFAASGWDEVKPLSLAIGKWKEWTAKRILALANGEAPLWQPEFFDHLLRSSESRSEKWSYIREDPVYAGLVTRAEDWPYAGWVDFE